MCGFLVTDSDLVDGHEVCSYLEHRGPDHTGTKNINEINFIHTLLSLTGDFTPQPVSDEHITVVFNGEIYNYKELGDYSSDVFAIIDCYKKYGYDFVKHLDGEFAIVIYDAELKKIFFTTDVFGTKPLFYSQENEKFGFSSYKIALEEANFNTISKLHANSFGVLDLQNGKLEISSDYFKFNLEQFKTDYEDWNEAFLNSINVRFKNLSHDIILPLSSGLDSGAIACALEKLKIKHEVFSYYGNEHKFVLFRRLLREYRSKNKVYIKRSLKKDDFLKTRELLNNKISKFSYGSKQENQHLTYDGFKDRGSHGLVYLLDYVKSRNNHIKILSSGQGGDEITSNLQSYSFGSPNPETFGENLYDIFPWENFYDGTQSSYLMKEESITGGFGIEGRYPFLDRRVVQEYLNLIPELKNKEFKAPIANFLISNNYPMKTGDPEKIKKGFNVVKENSLQKLISFLSIQLNKVKTK